MEFFLPPQSKRSRSSSSSAGSVRRVRSKLDMSREDASVTAPETATSQKSPNVSGISVRAQRALLEHGSPPIRIRQPDDQNCSRSSQVVERTLSKGFGEKFILKDFEDHLKINEPSAYKNVRPYMYQPMDPSVLDQGDQIFFDELWDRVERIYQIAKSCNDKNKDIRAWERVLWTVMDTMTNIGSKNCLEVNDVQSQELDPKFMPSNISSLNSSCKSEFVLTFSDKYHNAHNIQSVGKVYEKFRLRNNGTAISPIVDSYTSGLALAIPIVLKEAGGTSSEAEVRLAIYHAAMLWKIRDLINIDRRNPINGGVIEDFVPSVVGWTVVGHRWSLYISTLMPDGSIRCVGPYDALETNTSTHIGVLKLLNLIIRVFRMAVHSLWPTMESILEGNYGGWDQYFNSNIKYSDIYCI